MFDFEIKIVNWIRSVTTPFIDTLFEGITALGEQEILILVVLTIYFIYSKKAGQRIAFSIFTSLLFNNFLKGMIMRPRPFENVNATFDPTRVNTATGSAFPSGHTQNSAVAFTSVGILLKNKIAWIIISILIFLIGLSRLVLGVHYPSDVIVGAILGIGFAFFGAFIHLKVEENFKKQISLYVLVALLFFPFIFVFWRSSYAEIEIYRDFYTSYAFFIGYIISVALEHKFVDFDCRNSFTIRILRTVFALLIVLIIMFGVKAILPKENIIMDMIRYFLLSFVGLGIYPILTKKWLFFKSH